MDDDPIPTPKVKAAKTEGNMLRFNFVTMTRKCLMLIWKMNLGFTMMRTTTLQNRKKRLDHPRSETEGIGRTNCTG